MYGALIVYGLAVAVVAYLVWPMCGPWDETGPIEPREYAYWAFLSFLWPLVLVVAALGHLRRFLHEGE